jgi:hypothetical protein
MARRATPSEDSVGEVTQRQVDLNWLAGVGEMAGTVDDLKRPPSKAGQRPAVARLLLGERALVARKQQQQQCVAYGGTAKRGAG